MATKAVSDKRKAKSAKLAAAMMGNQNALGHGCGRPSKYDLPKEAKDRLLAMTPASYVGLAVKLAKEI